MEVVKTALIAILVFGFLIFIHEFGHYIFARIFKVTITEFSLGMGPKLIWYDSKKTGIRYCLSAIPFGGYVAMVGEDSESDDPNAFNKKPAWQRLIITVAGATVNIIVGILVVIIIISATNTQSTTIDKFYELKPEYADSSSSKSLMVGDEIIEVNGKRVHMYEELSYEIMRNGNEPVDITVIRNGAEEVIPDVVFPVVEIQGQRIGMLDFDTTLMPKTFGNVVGVSFTKCILIVRMCYESIIDLITGRFTVEAVSGPVGIAESLGSAAAEGVTSLLDIAALISINLGLMNLLPIPALDGGRCLLILVEMITRKKLPASLEAKINGISLAILLGLSAIIMLKDIIGLFV